MLEAYTIDTYYHYLGGLTTPDCDEIVHWFSKADPIKIPQSQYDDIEDGHEDFFKSDREV